jgi:hypothetical protein
VAHLLAEIDEEQFHPLPMDQPQPAEDWQMENNMAFVELIGFAGPLRRLGEHMLFVLVFTVSFIFIMAYIPYTFSVWTLSLFHQPLPSTGILVGVPYVGCHLEIA